MADIIDIADIEIQRSIERRIHNVRASIGSRMLKPNNQCHFCAGQLDNAGALFCDHDCAADHDKLMWQRSQKPMERLA